MKFFCELCLKENTPIYKKFDTNNIFSNKSTLFLVDGKIDDKKPILESDYDKIPGSYNLIIIKKKEQQIIIRNDRLGLRPLYYAIINNKLIISSDFWEIVHTVGSGKNKINYEAVAQLMKFRRLFPANSTLHENISYLPAASELTISNGKISSLKTYFSFKQKENRHVTIENIADSVVENIKKNLNRFRNDELWFGNSGGLDSRLIPAAANELGIQVNGFVVSDKYNKIFKNLTHSASDKIASYFHFQNIHLSFLEQNSLDALLRDIRVNPLGPGNFFKNPKHCIFKGKTIVNGGNSYIITNQGNWWKKYYDSKTFAIKEYPQAFLTRNEQISLDYDSKEYYSRLEEDIVNLSGDDNFSICRTFHQRFLNKTSPMGGFESMSYSGDFVYIYSGIESTSLTWPKKMFFDRQVQDKIFEKYYPQLSQLPDQSGKNILADKIKISKKIQGKLFTSGLSYYKWVKSDWYLNLQNNVGHIILNSGSELTKKIYNYSVFCKNSHDKMDLLKLSLMVHLLEEKIPLDEIEIKS